MSEPLYADEIIHYAKLIYVWDGAVKIKLWRKQHGIYWVWIEHCSSLSLLSISFYYLCIL